MPLYIAEDNQSLGQELRRLGQRSGLHTLREWAGRAMIPERRDRLDGCTP